LAIIAAADTESGKLARPVLMSLVKSAVEKGKLESEWLMETALWSLGQIPNPELPAEDVVALETGTVKFLQSSITSWLKRCDQTSATSSGGSYPGGFGPGGPGKGGPGMGGPGMGGPGGGGGGGLGGEEGGGPGGKGASSSRPKNPYDEQPKEVRNARRMLHQRLERLHHALAGTGKVSTTPSTKGLIVWSADDRKPALEMILSRIEELQKALNDDEISALDNLLSKTQEPLADLMKACSDLVGAEPAPVPPPEGAAGTGTGEGTDGSDDGAATGDSGK
jgi:hypothetical protein